MRCAACILFSAMFVWPACVTADDRPNIVVIMADDMGYSDIGCFGGEITTPTLDRLAAGGLRFTQFYNTGRCCPTRASLLTGLYPHQAGIGHMMNDRGGPGYRGDLNERCATIAEVLGPAGYSCYMVGKWHVTKQVGEWSGNERLASRHNWPMQRGFDRFYGTIHGAGSFYDPVSLTRDDDPITVPDTQPFYYTDAISQNAAAFVAEHDHDRPFFMYVAYTAPHWPLHALDEDIDRYRDRYGEGWDALRTERYARMIELGIINPAWALSPRGGGVPSWDAAPHPEWQKRAMAVYAAMIDRMDQGIGQIVEALETANQLDNTLILFLADNGGCAEGGTAFENAGYSGGLSRKVKITRDGKPVQFGHYATVMPGPPDTYQEYGKPWANASNTPFRMYKHFVHEGGIASPLIVFWPNGFDGRNDLRTTPAHVIDLMPTALDVAGVTYPARLNGRALTPLEGRSLLPVFRSLPFERGAIFWEHEGNRAVRWKEWKLVARGRNGNWELYNMDDDRTETNDLSESHAELVTHLGTMWNAWAERCNVLPWPD